MLPLTLNPAVKAGLGIAVVLSFVRLGAQHGWLTSSRSVVEMIVKMDGVVTLTYLNGECCQGRLRRDTYVHPVGVILRVAGPARDCRTVVLLRDQLEPELFRRLRINLTGSLRELERDER